MTQEAKIGKQPQPYKVPERIASATIHFMYGISEKGDYRTIAEYMIDKKFCLTADLIQEGFTSDQIEDAVNDGGVKVAPVFKKRISDLYWTEETAYELDKMAVRVERECGGDGTDLNVPAMGDVMSVGAALGSQQLAIAALAYAAHKGLIGETGIDRGMGVGNLFINKKNPLAGILLEEVPDAENQESQNYPDVQPEPDERLAPFDEILERLTKEDMPEEPQQSV
ncbi:hypothetical protein A2870_03080 [Candidatus Curtissbacteria bacterium RIFCSPHIGHO2_01_FULL_41_11]|uniref:Uncharacterized protein n=1 Tax=Candidatus Curtissbacteria bacterium RIFCSPHIGHO2_01_FULL_41_11 TaxID=1797711 RepID=A0A1F5G6Y7_9BACT|nr:MAG: hypothetical protein A2870_03080 [Candidatus Curtissbacteria bacterium RIFCSPHIGHO2_01_FULL_41_11]